VAIIIVAGEIVAVVIKAYGVVVSKDWKLNLQKLQIPLPP